MGFLLALLAAFLPAPETGAPLAAGDPAFRILLFCRCAGFRHDSIPAGVRAITELGAAHGFAVDATDLPVDFTDENLARYAAVVFLSTTGDILDATQQAAFERFIRAGKGFVGIHAAADAEYDWAWYGRLVGAYFQGHPPVQAAELAVLDRLHPATAHLPQRWRRTDEWYDFRASPRGNVHVLITLDERTYEGGAMGHDHPVAWCHRFDGGRAFYTAGGHTAESFAEPLFLEHLLGAIRWAAGVAEGDASATIDAHYDKVVLDDAVTDPMELAVAPGGRVIFVERGGAVKIWKPDTRSTVTAGFIDVFSGLEDGLLGITLDPSFADTGWLYVCYAPAGDEPKNVLSRLTLSGDELDRSSEVVLLEVPTQRDECCHSGGSLTFGPGACLYLSTGDNTSPFASDGYAPIDERPGRGPFDAQKSSADPFDLRGKILRIRPLAGGGYDIPPGNLFPPDGARGRGEIYAMGCRNPFRISVHPRSGWVFWGEVGPDASGARAGRGPAGYDEFNVAKAPGNFGWPYFVADNQAYHDYDFAAQESGRAYDAAAPLNHSPNATGRHVLPPAQPAWIWYPYAPSAEFPEVGSGERCAMAGPVYRFDGASGGPGRLPAYYDGSVFLYEWSRNWIMQVAFDERGERLDMVPFLGGLKLTRPMDLEIGPDGCLYLIEWGSGFGGGNPDAQVARIEHHPRGERPPLATASAAPTSGAVPLTVDFSADGSRSRRAAAAAAAAGADLAFAWDFDRDGAVDSRDARPTFTYRRAGGFTAQLTVTDGGGLSAVANVPISAGNTQPLVTIEWPPDGGVCPFGASLEYRVRVEDAEDGVVTDQRVLVQPALGHDTHAHPLEVFLGAAGTCRTLRDAGHALEADLFTVLSARYTDNGSSPVSRLTGRDEIILQNGRKQAEHASTRHGVRIEKSGDPAGGGECVVFAAGGEHVSYTPLNLHGIDAIVLRVGAGTGGAALELRLDSPGGAMLGDAVVAPQGLPMLQAGAHPLRIDFFERTGESGLILRLRGGGLDKQVVPASMFSHGGEATPLEPSGPGRAAFALRGAQGGLEALYFALEDCETLPEFGELEPTRRGVVPSVDFAATSGAFAGSGLSDAVGAVLRGWITVPRADRYTFFLESDDGARLSLGEDLIVDNDGLHAMLEKSDATTWREVRVPVPRAARDGGGTHELFIVYRAPDLDTPAVRLNWIDFEGPGVAVPGGAAESGGHRD